MQTDIKHAKGQDTVLDVADERIGRVYADAFLGAASAGGNADGAVEELEAVVAEVLDAFPKFAEAAGSAFLSHEERTALIDKVLGGRVAPVVLNTLKVLSQHNRLPVLRTVAREARAMLDKREGRVPVEVTSAAELAPAQVDDVLSTLRDKLGAEPVLRLATNPDLIGGLTIRVGDTVFDGSLRTIFAKARQSIIEQTVAKIEQHPEHFLSTEPAADA